MKRRQERSLTKAKTREGVVVQQDGLRLRIPTSHIRAPV